MNIGRRQLEMLISVASPTCLMFARSSDRTVDSLLRKGLLRFSPTRQGLMAGAVCITAAGLRVIADEMDAGRVDDAINRMIAEAAARRTKRANAAGTPEEHR